MLYLFGAIGLFILADSVRGYLTAKNKKRYLIQLFIGVPLVIAALFLFGPLFVLSPIKIGYSTLKENNLTLYYPAGRIDFAQDVIQKVKIADADNEKFYRTSIPIPVVIAVSKLDMLRFGSYPEAGGTGNELTINILERKATTNVIAHEMSHRYLAIITGKSIPAPNWFNEGLASYIGKMDYYKKPNELRADLHEGIYVKDILKIRGVLGTADWLKRLSWNKQGRELYGQTYLMVKYLFDKFGTDKMYEFVISLKNNDFEKAFLQSFNMTEEQFHQEFIASLLPSNL